MQELESGSINPQIFKNQTLQRLDLLNFSKWHLFMVLSLGLVWIFDGYEVSLISLFRKYIVQEYNEQTFKQLATSYQIGCIVGSMIFGISAFKYGRKNVFIITLFIYAIGIFFSFISINVYFFILGRFLTGISVGGQFTAVFAAIDQFLPPKYRGRVNIGIDGTWHLGGSFAAILNMIIGETASWRYLFVLGIIGVFSLLIMRRNIPQSPRWLLLKNKFQEANSVVKKIQYAVQKNQVFLSRNSLNNQEGNQNIQNELVTQRSQAQLPDVNQQVVSNQIKLQNSQQKNIFKTLASTLLNSVKKYKSRFFLAALLMFSQAFFFNLIYYKFPATLQNKFHLTQSEISKYMLPLSLSSFVSTLIIGPLFDKIGRKLLLLITYSFSGILLILSEYINELIYLQIFICVMFFFTSPAGSSANLIASQIFPTSSRTVILFIMFMIGMFGGIGGVWVDTVWYGSILMIIAGILGYILCPASQNKSLQQIQNM